MADLALAAPRRPGAPRRSRRVALALAVWLAGALPAAAGFPTMIWDTGFMNDGVIPDGNTTGIYDTRSLSTSGESRIAEVNVYLNISGGFNGDYYVYLAHGGALSVLLNRVGRTSADPAGYDDAGLNVKFQDGAANGDAHTYQLVAGYASLLADGGIFQPDARATSPLTVLDTDARSLSLSQFNGLSLNGDWTLFLADLSTTEQGTLLSWGLEITPVPEPAQTTLAFLLAMACFGIVRRCQRLSRSAGASLMSDVKMRP